MGATSVTGAGPGDAFPGNKTPALKELIREEVKQLLSSPWELVFSRFVSNTDPNDVTPIDTTCLYDIKDYELLAGVALNIANVPITQMSLYLVTFSSASSKVPGGFNSHGSILFSPDGGPTFVPIVEDTGSVAYVNGNSLYITGILPPNSPLVYVSNSGFFILNDCVHSFFNDTGSSCYMLLFKRKWVI